MSNCSSASRRIRRGLRFRLLFPRSGYETALNNCKCDDGADSPMYINPSLPRPWRVDVIVIRAFDWIAMLNSRLGARAGTSEK